MNTTRGDLRSGAMQTHRSADFGTVKDFIKENNPKFVVRLDDAALQRGETDFWKFVATTDRVDLNDGTGKSFHTMTVHDVDAILGHPVLLDKDHRPILGDRDRQVFSAALALRHGVVRNPNLTAKEKRGILDDLYSKTMIGDQPGGMIPPQVQGDDQIKRYTVSSMEDGEHGPPKLDFGDKLATFDKADIEVLLGRKIHRSVEHGKHELKDKEAEFLGIVMGTLEAIKGFGAVDAAQKISNDVVPKVRAEFGLRAAKRMVAFLRHQNRRNGREVLGKLDKKIEIGQRALACIQEMEEWLVEKPLVLNRPDGSAVHKLRAAVNGEGIVLVTVRQALEDQNLREVLAHVQSFVVEHNWAAVMSGADFSGGGEEQRGEVELPYNSSCFEFVVSGKRICVLMSQDPEGIRPTRMCPVFGLKAGWAIVMTYTVDDAWNAKPLVDDPTIVAFKPIMDLLIENIRAIAITLEAEVTQTEVVRIDAKLNNAREKRGKLPLYDYHVVSLAHRTRVAPRLAELDPDREYTRKRLHFRRGHWRQYPTHRTKIRWCLVGDPELGFVDKHYKL